jgi:hypothetical protein
MLRCAFWPRAAGKTRAFAAVHTSCACKAILSGAEKHCRRLFPT